jgi:membrane protease YdiL (CAAX protease family)
MSADLTLGPHSPEHIAVAASARPSVWQDWLRFAGFVAIVLLVGNAKSLLLPTTMAGSWAGVATGIAIVLLTLLGARLLRLDAAELGLTNWRAAAGPSIALGVGIVLGLTLLVAVAAHVLAAFGRPVTPLPPPGDLANLTDAQLWRRVFFFLPLDTAIPEELIFRGVIFAFLLRATRSLFWTVFWSSVCFMAWHGAIGLSEVPTLALGALVAKFGGYFLGGPVFSVPRLGTSVLLGCIVAHWLADALLMVVSHPSGAWLRALVFGA